MKNNVEMNLEKKAKLGHVRRTRVFLDRITRYRWNETKDKQNDGIVNIILENEAHAEQLIQQIKDYTKLDLAWVMDKSVPSKITLNLPTYSVFDLSTAIATKQLVMPETEITPPVKQGMESSEKITQEPSPYPFFYHKQEPAKAAEKVYEILDALKEKPPMTLTTEIEENIKKIVAICNNKYSSQSTYGNAALNRMMLLDADIAKWLTPEVITYLFTNNPPQLSRINRHPNNSTTIQEAIYYGFKDGLHTIQIMIADINRNTQKSNYRNNTLSIVKNITLSGGIQENESNSSEIYSISLKQKFEEITDKINAAKNEDKSDKLIKVPNYEPDETRQEVEYGFQTLCTAIELAPTIQNDKTEQGKFFSLISLPQVTLNDFCRRVLENEHALFNGITSHFFYDRAHLMAALEQDSIIKMADDDYSYPDIFRELIKQIEENPGLYQDASEQFHIRFHLASNYLKDKEEEVNLYRSGSLGMI